MKKILFVLTIFFLGTVSTFAATEQDQNAASFLAGKNIIVASSDYKLDSTITRREMLKVMMNLSGLEIDKQGCEQIYVDVPSNDWGCPYARVAAANGFIATSFGGNNYFRPNDPVTNIEALKMIMQAKGIPKAMKYSMCFPSEDCTLYDWKDQYRVGASEAYIIPESMTIFGNEEREQNAKRKDIFTISSFTFDDYKYWETEVTNATSNISLSTGENFTIPSGFMIVDGVAYSKDFGADKLGTQYAGIQISFGQGSNVSDTLYDSKNAAQFFYDITKDCSNCNLDNYSKIDVIGNTYFSINKTLLTSDSFSMGVSYDGWKNIVSYTAKTSLNKKEATLTLSYIEGMENEKEMQELFESVLSSFSR